MRSICHGDARAIRLHAFHFSPEMIFLTQSINSLPLTPRAPTAASTFHPRLYPGELLPARERARLAAKGPALNTCRDALVTDVLSLRLPGLLRTPRGSLPVPPPGASAAQVTQGASDSRSAHPSDCGKQRESANAAKCGCLLLSRSRLPNVMQESVGFCVSSEVLAWFPMFPVTLSPSRGPGEVL